MKHIDAIIFDLDGVIIDSEPLQEQVAKKTCELFEINVPNFEWATFKGRTDKAMFRHILEHYGSSTSSVKKLIDTKDQLLLEKIPDGIALIPNALEFIRKSRAKFNKFALATSSKKAYQKKIFDHWKLHDYFDSVTCGDEINRGKPDPEAYETALQKIDRGGAKTLVIEDSVNGIKSAKQAGCFVAGITTSFPASVLVESGADYIVNSFIELETLLNI